ncbi:MAG: hypothetical protein ACE5FJ_05350 [Gemmatimonadales bacterium]
MQVRSLTVALLLVVAVACSGRRDVPRIAPLEPRAAIHGFMSALTENDIERMGLLWGSRRGPAASYMDTQSMHQRLLVIRQYLQHDSYEIRPSRDTFPLDERHQAFDVHIERGGCTADVPFTLVHTDDGWLIEAIDLGTVGNPTRRCRERSGN